MSVLDLCLIRSREPSGQVVLRLGVPLVDDYREFLEGRCRPNTEAAAYGGMIADRGCDPGQG